MLLLFSLQATQKTRDFLLQRVYQMRKPMANYHMLQNQMLNYRLVGRGVLPCEATECGNSAITVVDFTKTFYDE